MKYTPTIGLEIHVELKTKTKMFCDSLNDPDERHPNVNVCPVCMGHPGTLPVPNEEALKKLIQVGRALNCEIAPFSKFDRKNYFYPDLPKGYQISQYDLPLCVGGWLHITNKSGITKKIRLERIHLEEDTGRLQHTPDRSGSLIDYNRAGVPLMELVTKADIDDPLDIEFFAKELRLLLRYIGASDVNMEKGQMRVEVNISIKPEGTEKFGTKVEIKNINSIGAAVRAAQFEVVRQTAALEAGEKIIQETRGWDEEQGATFSQRIKEGSADYRYFPEPDIPPLRFSAEYIAELESELPELPHQRRERFKKLYLINDAQAEVFAVARHLGDYYEQIISELKEWDSFEHKNLQKISEEHQEKLFTLTANYIITELPPILNMSGTEVDEIQGINITPAHFGELIVRIFHKELSSTNAKIVLKEMAETGEGPEQIMKEHDLSQVSDESALIEAVDHVIDAQPKAVEDYKKGKTEILKFLIGQAMSKTKGKGNPEVLAKIFAEKLKS